jgi:hypothetical protein
VGWLPLALLLLAPLRFPNSGAPAAQPAFLRGLTALHHFQYDEAQEAFRDAQKADPSFAMAYWGEAMAHNQTVWRNQDAGAAREVLGRLAPTPETRALKAPTERERAYLSAVETLYGDGDRATRERGYAEVMRRLAAGHPEDLEAQAFFALALLGTMPRGRTQSGEADDDPHLHALAGSPVQKEVAAVPRPSSPASPIIPAR